MTAFSKSTLFFLNLFLFLCCVALHLDKDQFYLIFSIQTINAVTQVLITSYLDYNDELLTGLPNFILITLKTILLSVTKGTSRIALLPA